MSRPPPPAKRRGALGIEDLRFAYEDGTDSFDLHVADLQVAAGTRTILTGASGCGKTTLLHLVAGILHPAEGRIRIDDTVVSDLPEAARRRFRIAHIGMVFQEFELIEHLTVRENALLPYYVHPALSLDEAARARLADLATSLGIEKRLDRKPGRLSQGERQRVAICRALVTEPVLVLADEPTGNLDPKTTRDMLDLVFHEVERRGAGFLMVTHDHTILDAFDRVVEFAALRAGGGR